MGVRKSELHRDPAAHGLAFDMRALNPQSVEHVAHLVDQRRQHLRVEALGLRAAVPEEIDRQHPEMPRERRDVADVVLRVPAGAVQEQQRLALACFYYPGYIATP